MEIIEPREVDWEIELTNHLPYKIYYNPKKDFIWTLYETEIIFLSDCPKGKKVTKKERMDPEEMGNILIGYLN